jgi:hypothetical protein
MNKKLAQCLLLALAACSQPSDKTAADPQQKVASAAPQAIEPTPNKPALAFGPDEAKAARAFVARYLTLIEAKKYAQALPLWTEYGQKSFRGDPALLATQYDRFTRFRAAAGPTSSIEGNPAKDRILVPVTADVVLRSDGSARALRGLVYLHRPNATDWQIDSVDIRRSVDD